MCNTSLLEFSQPPFLFQIFCHDFHKNFSFEYTNYILPSLPYAALLLKSFKYLTHIYTASLLFFHPLCRRTKGQQSFLCMSVFLCLELILKKCQNFSLIEIDNSVASSIFLILLRHTFLLLKNLIFLFSFMYNLLCSLQHHKHDNPVSLFLLNKCSLIAYGYSTVTDPWARLYFILFHLTCVIVVLK